MSTVEREMSAARKLWTHGQVRILLATVYLGLVTLLIFGTQTDRSYDDPFITYRYADNIAHGVGFVYNPGEKVQSTTTPLFALVLAPFAALSLNLPLVANLIGAASLAVGAVLLWSLAQTYQTPWAGWAALLLYPSFPLLNSTLGSETPLYLALCLGAFAAFARKRLVAAAVCAALALLARPDGLLVPVLLGMAFLLEWVRAPGLWQAGWWKAALVFGLVALPWFLFAWSYFGSPLPVTLAAKQQQGVMAISQKFGPGFFTILGWYKGWPFVSGAVLAAAGLGFVFWRARSWLLLLAWTVLYFAAYSFLGVTRYFWYYAPLVPAFVVLAGLGLEALSRWRVAAPARMQFVAAACLMVIAVGQFQVFWRAQQRVDPRYEAYKAAGEWLAAYTPEGARVAALEIGIIGYFAQRPVVDFAGLIQPAVADRMEPESTYEDTAYWAVDTYQPEYLVLLGGVFPSLEQRAAAECELEQLISREQYAAPQDILIYNCR